MKIAYIITNPLPSEKANIIQSMEMAFALCKAGAEVDFFCPKAEVTMPDDMVRKWLECFFARKIPFNIKFVCYKKFMGRFGSLLNTPALISAVSMTRPYDFYYVRNYALLDVLTRLGKPVIYEQHQWNSYSDRFRNSILRWILVRASKRRSCRLFICISEILRKRWEHRGVPRGKILTAHDAVNLDLFSPPLSRHDARQALGIGPAGMVVSYVGSLYRNRAIDDVIRAAERIPSATFRFIGGPENERQRLMGKVAETGLVNVEFIGRVARDQIPLHLFASDVLLFTMNRQTLTFDICSPMKIFEYLAASRLIVAPNLPSMREVLRAPYAFLYTFPEQESLIVTISAAIAAAKDGAVEKLGNTARNQVLNYYTWQVRARAILKGLE
jgi:glycosyltransferase involved in cell wall biosynthesis